LLVDQQIQIEKQLKEEAALRLRNDSYKAAARQAWSESKLGLKYTRGFTQVLCQQLQTLLLSTSTVGRGLTGLKLLQQSQLQADVIAFLTIKSLFNSLPLVYRTKTGVRRVSMAIRIAKLLEEELRIRHFSEDKTRRNLLKKLTKTFDKRQYPREWRRRTIKNYFDAERMSWTHWSDEERLHIGMFLLLTVRDTTGAIELTRESSYVYPAEPLVTEVASQLASGDLSMLLHRPTLTEPTPWTPENIFNGGGYINASE